MVHKDKEKMEKTKKLTKASPLLLLVIGILVIGMVGATIIELWTSEKITHEFEIQGIIEARALDAKFSGYSAQMPATILVSDSIGVGVSDAFVIVIDQDNVDDVILDLDVVVKRGGVEQIGASWTAKTNYVCYWYDGAEVPQLGKYPGPGQLTDTSSSIVIPQSDVNSYMDYYLRPHTVAGSPTIDDTGGLLIEFTSIDGNGGWGVFTVEITASLSADNGA